MRIIHSEEVTNEGITVTRDNKVVYRISMLWNETSVRYRIVEIDSHAIVQARKAEDQNWFFVKGLGKAEGLEYL